jgi:serine/threonine-protein kinase
MSDRAVDRDETLQNVAKGFAARGVTTTRVEWLLVGRPQDNDDTRRISEDDRKAAKQRLGDVVADSETMADPGPPAPAAEGDLAPGTRVGEYEVEQVIGRGGFGVVYRATQPLIGKRVAIKVLSRKYSADHEIVSRFVSEARAVNQIRHRHIIDIFSFGQLPDHRHYYVMEHLDGEPLDTYIAARGPMSVPEALPILRAIARALDAAHAKGIAHRDLKPENIFLARTTDGDDTELWPKLLDFGIAKLMGSDDALAHKTGTGVPIGTPYYMSPEQCRGRDVDHRTDIYSFGVLAYRMLTGTYPFEGDVIDILHKQMHETPESPSARNAALSHEADRAVLWMMQKDPAQRPSTAIAAVVALQDDKTPTPMLSMRDLESRERHAAVAASTTTIAPKRSWALPIAGLVLIAGGVAGFFAMREPSKPAPIVAPTPVIDAREAAIVVDAPPEPVLAPLVTIAVPGVPDGTQVMLAGAVIGVTPTPIQVKRGTDAVTLVFQADGYHPTSVQVTPDEDREVVVKLTKKKKPVGAQRPEDSGDALADPFKKKKR